MIKPDPNRPRCPNCGALVAVCASPASRAAGVSIITATCPHSVRRPDMGRQACRQPTILVLKDGVAKYYFPRRFDDLDDERLLSS